MSNYSSNDYKKIRFTGNGTVTDGILTDSSTGNTYKCYIGISATHNHFNYDRNINIYEIINNNLGNPIKLNDFISGINSKKF